MNSNDAYIVLQNHVRKNTKTKEEELDITLFDVSGKSLDGEIVELTIKSYDENRRSAQDHEIEKFKSTVRNQIAQHARLKS